MASIDTATIIGWVIFAVVNSATTAITARYTNRVLDRGEKYGKRDVRSSAKKSSRR